MKKIKVVIPIYKESLLDLETSLLKNNLEVLRAHTIEFVIPYGLNLDLLRKAINIDNYKINYVSEEFLGHKNGIKGYNKMMLSTDFYNMFSDAEYILICQTDVFIFRDELDLWCSMGYDYVGAPWPKKKKYSGAILKLYISLHNIFKKKKGVISRYDLFYKVGNGGLSLRKVSSFRRACVEFKDEIDIFCANPHYLYNEDVFWALIPRNFKYPEFKTAIKFSMDIKPDYCLSINNNQFPFGCHGLTQPKIFNFWKDYILIF